MYDRELFCRTQLIEELFASNVGLSFATASKIVDELIAIMSVVLIYDDSIALRRFGSFATKRRNAMVIKNPKTGKLLNLGTRKVLYFRASKYLLGLINNNQHS